MKNFPWNSLILLLLLFNAAAIFSQNEKTKIKQDSKIDSLLQKKIALDRARFENTYFTLQLYYGNVDTAKETLERSREIFPHIPVELSFETPNYKVQAGRFKDKLVGLKTLDTVKRDFPAAFLLTRRKD